MRWCGEGSEKVKGAGLEQLSLILVHAFTLGDDAPVH